MSDLNLPRIVNPNMDEVRYSGHGEDFRRLLTPEIVCNFRAAQVPFSRIPYGFILDPAAGSGGQLAAYGERFGVGCVGVELSPQLSLIHI